MYRLVAGRSWQATGRSPLALGARANRGDDDHGDPHVRLVAADRHQPVRSGSFDQFGESTCFAGSACPPGCPTLRRVLIARSNACSPGCSDGTNGSGPSRTPTGSAGCSHGSSRSSRAGQRDDLTSAHGEIRCLLTRHALVWAPPVGRAPLACRRSRAAGRSRRAPSVVPVRQRLELLAHGPPPPHLVLDRFDDVVVERRREPPAHQAGHASAMSACAGGSQ